MSTITKIDFYTNIVLQFYYKEIIEYLEKRNLDKDFQERFSLYFLATMMIDFEYSKLEICKPFLENELMIDDVNDLLNPFKDIIKTEINKQMRGNLPSYFSTRFTFFDKNTGFNFEISLNQQ